MKILGRDLRTVLKAPFHRPHYVAAANMLRVYRKPVGAYTRYLFQAGDYPCSIEVRTPLAPLDLRLYSYHDILTVNEIFCREDYLASAEDAIFVDFGSNIGVSAAYFLTRGPNAFVYCFEPMPRNIERLQLNLSRFSDRYALTQAAVGLSDGEVEFGCEETGRYGGIGVKTGQYVSVKCLDSNRVIEEIVERHGRIDILKIDIETLEKEVVQRLAPRTAARINKIYAECRFERNPLAETHAYAQYGSVARLTRRQQPY
jgi:FkbM family methyltransferase